jgi:hypothetical protein
MKKIIVIIILFTTVSNASACDVCGCSLGGNYFGLMPHFNKNFIGVRWSQAQFYAHMNHHSEYFQDEYSHDTYHKLEVWGRINISSRLQLFAFIPYSYNNMNGSLQKVNASGMGDVTIIGNYKLFNTAEDSNWKQMMTVGGGIKLPTGRIDQTDRGKLVNPNFQLGTGSVDFLLNTVYQLRYKNSGVNLETGYKINTRNKNDYHFGNQWYVSSQLFYSKKLGSITLLPNAGAYFEESAQHKDGESRLTNTGGHALFLSTGMETYFKSFSIGANYKHPLSQQYNSDSIADIRAADRWMISMTYSF